MLREIRDNPALAFALIIIGLLVLAFFVIWLLSYLAYYFKERRDKKKPTIDRDIREHKSWVDNFKDSYFN